MQTFKKFYYHTLIKEQHLDSFGHVNNAAYLVLLEEARWAFITQHNYGLKVIQEKQIGPTILQINLIFKRELKLRDEITIESQILSYEKKISKLSQNILRGDEICCEGELVLGLFDLRERKLILPTHEWLNAIGYQE